MRRILLLRYLIDMEKFKKFIIKNTFGLVIGVLISASLGAAAGYVIGRSPVLTALIMILFYVVGLTLFELISRALSVDPNSDPDHPKVVQNEEEKIKMLASIRYDVITNDDKLTEEKEDK